MSKASEGDILKSLPYVHNKRGQIQWRERLNSRTHQVNMRDYAKAWNEYWYLPNYGKLQTAVLISRERAVPKYSSKQCRDRKHKKMCLQLRG